MWIRLIAGLALCAVGALWIAQGVGVAKGSMMTGHPAYAGLGAVVLIAGLFLLFTAWRARSGKPPQQ
jgi:predicted anti-sigma-YlaC factor YlaD